MRRKTELIEGEVHPCTNHQEDVGIWGGVGRRGDVSQESLGAGDLRRALRSPLGSGDLKEKVWSVGNRRGEGGAGRMLMPPHLCWSRAGGCGREEGGATISWDGFRSLLKSIRGSKRRREGRGRSPKLVDVAVGRKRYGDGGSSGSHYTSE